MRLSSPRTFPTGVVGAATGVYEEKPFSYTSSIDGASLRAKYCRDLGFSRTKIAVGFTHGWAQTGFDVTSADMQGVARLGLTSLVVELRGRNGSLLSQDGGGREEMDVFDAVRALYRIVPGLDVVSRINGPGGSGGAFQAWLSTIRHPFYYDATVGYFGFTDPGVDGTFGWWSQAPSQQATLLPWIGDRAVSTDPFRARNIQESIATWPGNAGRFFIYHDTGDGTVNVNHSQRIDAALTAAGIAHVYHESQAGDAKRWSHGLPHDNADIPNNYDDPTLGWATAVKALTGRTCPTTGSGRVIGYMDAVYTDPATGQDVSPFEVWSAEAATPLPRAAGEPAVAQALRGGTRGVADLTWDLNAGTFTIDPKNGTRWWWIKRGNKSVIQQVSALTTLTPV
jgi:hypothetical protein